MQKTNQQTIVAEDGDTQKKEKILDNKTEKNRDGSKKDEQDNIEKKKKKKDPGQAFSIEKRAPISITAPRLLLYIYCLDWQYCVAYSTRKEKRRGGRIGWQQPKHNRVTSISPVG